MRRVSVLVLLACAPLVATVAAVPPPAEDRLFVDLLVDLELSSSSTAYWYVPFVENRLSSSMSLVGFEPLVRSPYLHHYHFFSCSWLYSRRVHGPEAFDMPRACEEVYGWAVGGDPLTLPPEAGFRASRFLALQVHYSREGAGNASSTNATGVRDTSGVRVFFAPRRPNDMWTLRSGGGVSLFEPDHKMPPGRGAFFDTHACVIQATSPMTCVVAVPHAHLTGRRIWTDLLRYNKATQRVEKVAELGRDDAFSFHRQRMLEQPNVLVLPGDVLSTTCVYNTTDRSGVTSGGFSTTDEMCYMFLGLWPDAGRCVWHGVHDRSKLFAAASGDAPEGLAYSSQELYALADRKSGIAVDAGSLAAFMSAGKPPVLDAEKPRSRWLWVGGVLAAALALLAAWAAGAQQRLVDGFQLAFGTSSTAASTVDPC